MQSLFQTNPLTELQHVEISINLWTQQNLHFAEPLWTILTEYFSVAKLTDVWVPLVGVFHHQLLVRLVCSLSVINLLNSLVKWCLPAFRPYSWIREFSQNESLSLQQHRLTCETTGGFPSSHAMAFTTFMYLLVVFSLTNCCHKVQLGERYLNFISHFIVALASLGMWLSRLFMATTFLHQCIVGSLAAIALLHCFDQHSTYLYTMSRKVSVMLVIFLSFFPVIIYFTMPRMNLDPHWSVRMAFKWCSDPSFLRHEASPIFVLGRDFGYLMGVALSAPMYKRYESKTTSLYKRLPLIVVLELVNYFARSETPKQRGRFIFVAYEFLRNLMHSYTLLSVKS